MLDRFLEENRLVIEKQFTEGSRCQGVYLVKKDHTPMILKISDIPSEMAEIERRGNTLISASLAVRPTEVLLFQHFFHCCVRKYLHGVKYL